MLLHYIVEVILSNFMPHFVHCCYDIFFRDRSTSISVKLLKNIVEFFQLLLRDSRSFAEALAAHEIVNGASTSIHLLLYWWFGGEIYKCNGNDEKAAYVHRTNSKRKVAAPLELHVWICRILRHAFWISVEHAACPQREPHKHQRQKFEQMQCLLAWLVTVRCNHCRHEDDNNNNRQHHWSILRSVVPSRVYFLVNQSRVKFVIIFMISMVYVKFLETIMQGRLIVLYQDVQTEI